MTWFCWPKPRRRPMGQSVTIGQEKFRLPASSRAAMKLELQRLRIGRGGSTRKIVHRKTCKEAHWIRLNRRR